ncbi:MAG TPA: TspO/MBR family protein [Burkholderiales bacterium]
MSYREKGSDPFFRWALGLAGWLALTFACAAIGAFASSQASTFYAQLARPGWGPPGWLFGPVWSVLYVLMALAAWRVWRRHGFGGAGAALGLFIVQLAANALWTWLFFVWHMGALAFAEIVVLWSLILATIIAFRKLDALAAALLVPYLLWVSFATALNFTIWRMNPGVLG